MVSILVWESNFSKRQLAVFFSLPLLLWLFIVGGNKHSVRKELQIRRSQRQRCREFVPTIVKNMFFRALQRASSAISGSIFKIFWSKNISRGIWIRHLHIDSNNISLFDWSSIFLSLIIGPKGPFSFGETKTWGNELVSPSVNYGRE